MTTIIFRRKAVQVCEPECQSKLDGMNTIVQFRLRQEGGDLRWKHPKVYEPHETPELPEIGELVSPPGSVGGGECRVTEITELISREIGNEVTTITVILRRAAK